MTEGYEKQYADILTDGKYIKEIREPGYNFIQCNCKEIDIDNKTVIPGLLDLHVHLYLNNANYSYPDLLLNTPGETIYSIYSYAKLLLSLGITTVRDCGCDHYYGNIATRNAIDKGIIEGPRIISCGKILTPTENSNDYFKSLYEEADGPEEFRKAARNDFKQGSQFIKIMGTGAMLNPNGVPGQQIVHEDEFIAAYEVAKMKDSYIAVHAHGEEAIKCAFKCGAKTIEHASFIDKEGIELIKAERKNARGIIPTMFINHDLFNVNENDGYAFVKDKLGLEVRNKIKTCLYNAYKSGVLMGWGTDVFMGMYKENPGMEFIMRKEFLEFENIDILKQATINSAILADLDHVIGTIKEGKYADLVVIDGNPDEDIHVMNQLPLHVFKEGKKIIT